MYALDYLQHTRRYVLDQETLPLSISTDWFQERIQAWIHNRTESEGHVLDLHLRQPRKLQKCEKEHHKPAVATFSNVTPL